MALQGSLKELRLGDVLQTVLSAGNRGLFRIRNGGRRAVLHLSTKGLRLIEPDVIDDRLIIDSFLHRGTLPQDVVDRARAAAGAKGSALETLLIGGSIDQSQLDALVAEAVEDGILDVLSWTDGNFRFEEGVDPEGVPSRAAGVGLDPAGLLLRAAQRMDERKRIVEQIGPHALLLLPGDARHLDVSALEFPADTVLLRLDGHALLDEISLEEGLGLFAVQKAAARLVGEGIARLPDPDEMAVESEVREKAGDVRAALGILRQWQTAYPDDPAPLEAAAALAAKAQRHEDEADALRALGRVQLKAAQPTEARETFDRVLAKRPGDREALEGLRQAARACGDTESYARTTRELAGQDLQSEDYGTASNLLQELLAAAPEDLEARLLRAKALVRLGDRGQAIEEMERLGSDLPSPCRKKAHREAAGWCRDTLARLAPERSDLMRTFRDLTVVPGAGRKRALILGSLVLACSGVGFVLWPRPATSLLARAREAAEHGDNATALSLIAEIEEKYSDDKQYDEAVALKARLDPAGHGASNRADPKVTAGILAAASQVATAALPKWPEPTAIGEADRLVDLLRSPEASSPSVRKDVSDRLRSPLADAVAGLREGARARRDALERAPQAAQKPPANLENFRAIVEKAKAALDLDWTANARRAAATARRLAGLILDAGSTPGFATDLQAVESEIDATTRAVTAGAGDVDRLRREFHRALIQEAYERARSEAPKTLVRGDLDGAEACYTRLDSLLTTLDTDPALRPLKEQLEKRGILDYAVSRGKMMRSIRDGLKAATEAEKTGNLSAAAEAYARLAEQFPLVKFDAVFTIPVRVLPTPPTARVSLNGTEIKGDPAGGTVVRYGWGAPATVVLTADGYEPMSVMLRTADPKPVGELPVRLMPTRRWTKALTGIVEAPLLAVEGSVVLCNRAGRVERRSRDTGEPIWGTETKVLEGVRGRPAYEHGLVWVPLVDGHVARLVASTGSALPPLQLRARPVGDAASLPGRVAFGLDDALAVFAEGDAPTYVPVPSTVTAGVLAAYGAFWVGDATGGVTRVDGSSLAVRTLPSGAKEPIVALARGDGAVYALSGDGTLYAVESRGAQTVLWKRPGMGDPAGAPAEADGIVGVPYRDGRVQLFDARDGTPRGEKQTGSTARGGLIAAHGHLVASLSDGRLWVCAPATGTVLVDAELGGTAALGPVDLDNGSVVVPSAGGVSCVPLPK